MNVPFENIVPIGLDDVTRKLNKLADNAPEYVNKTAVAVSGLVVEAARPEVPRVSGVAASSLRSFATNEGASVVGGENVEYYAWLELGGASGRGGSNIREFVEEGRYINPAYDRVQPQVDIELHKGLRALVTDSGLHLD